MNHPRGTGAWQEIVFTIRCPYCAEGDQFRSMVGLNGTKDGPFFCSKCHHLAHPADSGFKCLCAHCRKANPISQSA